MKTEVTEYLILTDEDWIKKITFISGLNPEDIKLLFGKSDFKYRGSEYLIDNWGLEFNNTLFILNSANKRGTSTESECKDILIIKGFYNELVKMFLDINNEKINRLKVFLK